MSISDDTHWTRSLMSAVAAARETDMPRSCNSASRVSTRPSTQVGFVVIVCLPVGLAVRQCAPALAGALEQLHCTEGQILTLRGADRRLGLRPSADLRPSSPLPRLAPPADITPSCRRSKIDNQGPDYRSRRIYEPLRGWLGCPAHRAYQCGLWWVAAETIDRGRGVGRR